LKALHQKNIKKKDYKLNVNGTDERDLELALEASKKDFGGALDEDYFGFGNQYLSFVIS